MLFHGSSRDLPPVDADDVRRLRRSHLILVGVAYVIVWAPIRRPGVRPRLWLARGRASAGLDFQARAQKIAMKVQRLFYVVDPDHYLREAPNLWHDVGSGSKLFLACKW